MKFSAHVLWYDAWVGFFWDKAKRILYFCPVPCVVLKFQFKRKCTLCDGYGQLWISGSGDPVFRDSYSRPCMQCKGTGDQP